MKYIAKRSQVQRHPKFNETDYLYLLNKGYSQNEIMEIWNKELDNQKGSVTHNIDFGKTIETAKGE